MTETPYDRYSYPEEGEPNWNRDEGPENIWEQQEIEITGEVEQYIDLPEPDPGAETDDGQRRTYLVAGRKTIYRDTGSEWEAVAGVGDEANPLPGTSHFERAQVHEEPTEGTDVVRWTDLDGLGGGDVSNPLEEDIDANNEFSVTNLREPDSASDAATREFVLDNAGGNGEGDVSNPLEEDLDADGEYTVTNLRGPEQDGDAATREFVLDNAGGGGDGDVSNPMTEDLDADDHNIENVGSLHTEEVTVGGQDFATKADRDGDSLTPEHISNVAYAEHYDTLNDAVADNNDGDSLEIILPEGVTTFTSNIAWRRDVVITGRGKSSIVQSDGADRLVNEFPDMPNISLILRDLTIDMNGTPTEGDVIRTAGERGGLHLDGVHVENINLENQGSTSSFVGGNDHIHDARFTDCEFRYDTITNRQEYKYSVFHLDHTRLRVRDCHHVGELIADRFDSDGNRVVEYFNGYLGGVYEYAHVSGCTFKEWDQYGTFLQARDEYASIHVTDCTTYKAGRGDFFRSGTSIQNGGSISYTGLTFCGTGEVDGEKLQGDRAMVIEGSATPALVSIDGCTVRDTLVAISAPQMRNATISNLIAQNIGNIRDDGNTNTRGIIIHSGDGWSGYVTFDNVQIINDAHGDSSYDNPRSMHYGIRLRHQSGTGFGWDGPAFVNDCVLVGYEGDTAINDDDGAVNVIENDNNYVRDRNGDSTPVV